MGDVVTLHYGKALNRELRKPDGAVPVYGANGVKAATDRALAQGPSLVIGRKGSAGQIIRVDGPFWALDVSFYTSHDESRVAFDFLQYTLSDLDLPSLARGVKPGINRHDVYALAVRLPSLDEQHRIVAVLDSSFDDLERASIRIHANLADLGELRESILRRAFAGELS